MKLSTRSRYAARAVIEIAKFSKEKPVSRKSISDNQQISSSYLENILIVLKNQGIIKTIRGPKGGYTLGKDPSEISMFDIVSAFEGSFALVHCIDEPQSCERFLNCPTRLVWEELKAVQLKVLKKYTIEKLIEINEKNQFLDFAI